MNDTFKNVMIGITIFFTSLFLLLSIGMCFKGFRYKVYDIWDVVPEKQLNSLEDSNSDLKIQMQTNEKALTELNSKKAELEQKISVLEANSSTDAETIANYKEELEAVNMEISNLQAKLNEVTAVVNNAVVYYEGNFSRVDYMYYDENMNSYFQYSTGGSEGYSWQSMGYNLMVQLDDYERKMEEIKLSIGHSYEQTTLRVRDVYGFDINGSYHSWDTNYYFYHFNEDVVCESTYMFDGETMDKESVQALISSDLMYYFTVEYSFGLDAENKISSLSAHFNINLNP